MMASATPAVLRWARESHGLDVETAAKKIGIKPEVLAEAEAGRAQLTFAQLTTAAGVYKRPLAAFFLREAPVEEPIVADFRRLPDADQSTSPELRAELRRLNRKRAIAMRIGTEYRDWSFVGSLRGNEDPDTIGHQLRTMLGVTPETKRQWKNDDYKIFGWWRAAVEAMGVFVFLSRRIDTTEMRGLSIAQKPYPLISLNRADSPRARLFSLLHELTHVFLGKSGMCDLSEDDSARVDSRRVEVFCNAVAAEALIPRAELLAHATVLAHRRAGATLPWQDTELRLIASDFGVSNEATLRRLVTVGFATPDEYATARRRWLMTAQLTAEDSGGGYERAYEIVMRTQGLPYVQLVLGALYQDKISLSEVADYLDIKLDHLGDLALAARGEPVPKPPSKPPEPTREPKRRRKGA